MRNTFKIMLTASLMFTATLAMAHPVQNNIVHTHSDFLSGLMHPFMGLDHLLAMAAIGFWSMRQNDTMKRGTPLFMVAGMLFGAVITLTGINLAGIETGIGMSVLLAGVLIATLAKLPTAIGGTLVAMFMVVHGYAHGLEMAVGSNVIIYMVGFVVATLVITFGGRALGSVMQKSDNRITRALGGAVAIIGGLMAAS
ncbi:HupE/UreJ family protein [Psychrobacter sp.]|uniref:HupE/UreJ family protein n=1 Tax=Psychrobacter sp. TaxID=56811 RepID=UPI0025FF0D09|nr:HupE/UreJ family protein [Psychrobacter sp.]